MNINEQIETVKNLLNSNYNLQQMSDILCELGFYVIGEGHYSTVYEHEELPDIVVKLCNREGDSWPFYAKFCKDNENNESVNSFLPKIHYFTRIRSNWAYIAILDKLKPVYDTSIKYDYDIELSDLYCGIEDIEDIMVGFWQSCRFDFMYNTLEYRDCTSGFEMNKLANIRATNRNSELFEVCRLIYKELSDYCTIDIHLDNFMHTVDNKIVITDPVSQTDCRTSSINSL